MRSRGEGYVDRCAALSMRREAQPWALTLHASCCEVSQASDIASAAPLSQDVGFRVVDNQTMHAPDGSTIQRCWSHWARGERRGRYRVRRVARGSGTNRTVGTNDRADAVTSYRLLALRRALPRREGW